MRIRRVLLPAGGVACVAAVGYLALVGHVASRLLVEGDGVKHHCLTPTAFDWPYEAVNYDRALDDRLPLDNPDPGVDCQNRGGNTAGDKIVTTDGVRIAGWYIPSGNGDGPEAPTIVLAHGWNVDKSDMLRYAATLHDDFNLAILDFRGRGRSGPGTMSLGTLEARDLRAFIDWLVRTKHPSRIGVLGDSGGAAAAARLARTDPRIAALALESPYARMTTLIETGLADNGHPPLPPSVLAVLVGIAIRTGAWPDADSLGALSALGTRPLAISYGTADARGIPEVAAELLYRRALELGLDVEVHPVVDAEHGKVVDASPEAYRAWVVPFFTRALER